MPRQEASPTQRVRVVVADGQPLYRDALARVADEHPQLELVGEAENAEDALEKVRALSPEVAVVDWDSLKGGGRGVLEAVVESGLPTRVLLLSSHAEGRDVLSAVSGGASGYLTKDADADAIGRAILTVSDGGNVMSPDAESALFSGVQAPAAEQEARLTDREVEILRLAAEGQSNAEIGRKLYLSSETVKSHLHNAYGKLGARDRTAAVARAIRSGLIS